MSSRRYIKGNLRKSDFLRAVLTDTSPYELPIIISNDGFYRNLTSRAEASETLRSLIESLVITNDTHYTIPFRFNVSKDSVSRRKLSLIHPASQYSAALFYAKYDTIICYYCSLSNSSIRKPTRVGSTFFFRSSQGESNTYKNDKIDTTDVERLVRNPASFFSYSGVDRLHKFFGSAEFVRLEKKYAHMRLADISKCFPSIYTHSVSWAVKSSQHSKDNNLAISFGNDFDKLMQKMNYNETNGIAVGPELSRVFAEIILSAVDAEVTMKSRSRGFVVGRDFEYRRYVDDFILFCHSKDVAAEITSIIEDCLSDYNLHVNNAKTDDFARPFVTPKSHVIDNAKKRLSSFFEGTIEKTFSGAIKPKRLFKPDAVVKSLIASIKSGCFEEEVGYDLVANYVISSLVKRVEALVMGFDELIAKSEVEPNLYPPLLLKLMEAIFFFYTVSPTVASSFSVSRAMIVFWRFLSDKLPDEMLSASGQMQRWVSQLMRQPSFQEHLNKQEKIPVEFLNIILAASDIRGVDQFDPQLLKRTIFAPEKEDYFSLVSCLFYVKNQPAYSELRSHAERSILKVLDGCSRVRNHAHDAHLALDAICCPYLPMACRVKILADFRHALDQPVRTAQELEADVAEMETKPWFVQWEKVDLLRMVTKKELSAVY